MSIKEESVLVAGFNTRPLVYSLSRAGYGVYAVDFFGDLDLYPYVKDCLILTKKLSVSYDLVKNNYSEYLPLLILELLEKYPEIKYLIIGSGLDDAIEERALILKEINRKKYKILNLNNELEAIKKSRDREFIFNFLKKGGFDVPRTVSLEEVRYKVNDLEYPFILKKRSGSGGTNIYKIHNKSDLSSNINLINRETFDPKDWLIQEYIEGNPVSCTTISNGEESEVISVNHQIVGDKSLNAPKEFMYCGNVVPANVFAEERKLIVEISLKLSAELGLKGINGFDFVLRNQYPYIMEINPRIPGSIRASEEAMNINLLDLHIKSFTDKGWEFVKKTLKDAKIENFTTKMIFFAPKEIDKNLLNKINDLEYVHDKPEPVKNIYKGEPVCTILFKANSFSDSYLGSLKVVDKINKIIK
ncbi:MAG TPA: ATP-grasp domain-containing protein [Candidatus Nanopelagicaceae bacterium]|nr:ATP-grasp domain-containing protein [Candidatus Nanopelagicaceae bacterium]